MKLRNSFALLLTALLLIAAGAPAQSTNDTLTALQGRLNAIVNQTRFAQAQWGVKVVALDSGKIVFAHNSDKFMKPASNAKMYTTSLALVRLGPDYRIKTSFYAPSKPDAAGVIHGDLLVYGRGDPSFASRFNDGDYAKSLQPVVEALKAAGIKRIEGDLIGDDSYFRGPSLGTEWTWDDLQNYYGAPANALMTEDNCIDLTFKPGKAAGEPCQIITMPETTFMAFSNRTETTAPKTDSQIDMYRPLGENVTYVWGRVALGSRGVDDSVSVSKPALWFVTLLKTKLEQNGIEVTGGPRSIGWLERDVVPLDLSKLTEVASVESRPLSEIVKNTLKPSQNQYAQLLLLQVGAKFAHPDEVRRRDYTEDEGLAEMRRFLAEAGVKRGQTWLQEGSGLSRGALVTASASVQLLTYMAHNRYGNVFMDGLPIAGVDGTLRRRFKGTAAEGNVHAKTGSLGGVDTLSGYMTTKAHDKLVFSVMLNNYRGSNGRAEIDSVVEMLANFAGKLQ